jgi:ectoine hydroxylase-related dioxygenase (phytanoyl-CoA dioxygenase family)
MITQENVRRYRDEGYTICRDVVPVETMDEMRATIDGFINEMSTIMRPEHLDRPHVWHKRFLDMCKTPEVLDHVEQLIGPNIVLFSSHLISKSAGDGLRAPWHQDANFWSLEPMNVITLWLAIDDSTVENGCMRIIPGTHTLGPLTHGSAENPHMAVLHEQLPAEAVDESRAVNCELNAGDCSFHAPYAIHGSTANTSDKRRCGFTMRFMPAETKMRRDGKFAQWFANHPLFLLRGRDVNGVNIYANV